METYLDGTVYNTYGTGNHAVSRSGILDSQGGGTKF